jgi:hypothetical protein
MHSQEFAAAAALAGAWATTVQRRRRITTALMHVARGDSPATSSRYMMERQAATALQRDGYLLEEDVTRMVERAASVTW